MDIRLTRRPRQAGTKKFTEHYGERLVCVRIGYEEVDLRERAKRLGAIWRSNHRLWEMRWLDAKRLGIADRVPPD